MFSTDRVGVFVLALASIVILSIVVFYFSHKVISESRKFRKQVFTAPVETLPFLVQFEEELKGQPFVPSSVVLQSFQPAFPIFLLGKLSGCMISQEKIAGSLKQGGEPSGERSVILEPLLRECSQEDKCEFRDNIIRIRSPLLFDGRSCSVTDSFYEFFLDVFTTLAIQGAFFGASSGATLHIPFPIQPPPCGEVSDAYASAFVEGFTLASTSYTDGGGLVDALNLGEIKFCCEDHSSFRILVSAFNNSTVVQSIGNIRR